MPVPEEAFQLLVVPGVTVNKWSRIWSERLPAVVLRVVPTEGAQVAALLSADADAGLVRLPVDQDVLHAIPLYTETTVVVFPRDHLFAAADELTLADLADEPRLRPLDDVLAWADAPATDRPATTAAAVELVAAGVGVLVVPQSLARAYQRRDLTYRVITDAPTSTVALVWPRDRHNDLVEEMIGIVRGRTANSTRGRPQPTSRSKPPAGRTDTRRGGPSPGRRGR